MGEAIRFTVHTTWVTGDRQATRRTSTLVFGNEKVAEVIAALGVAPGGVARTTDIVEATGIAHGMVRPVLTRMVEVGLLVALPRRGGSRGEQWYEVQHGHPLWAPMRQLGDAISVNAAEAPARLR
jgi:hypothetical protein